MGKKGVVRDPQIHEEVINSIIEEAQNLGFFIKGLSFSPIKGPEGNIEYLLYLACEESENKEPFDVIETVKAAHESLDKE